MVNYRVLLIKIKIHSIVPFPNLILKIGNFVKLSLWIHKNRTLAYNDFYSSGNNYNCRYKLYDFLIESEVQKPAVNYLEFGVSDGETIKWWVNRVKQPEAAFIGFDTFEGLPEDWGIYKKGSFTNNGEIPSIEDQRVKFYKGLFQETLPGFLDKLDGSRKNIILLDADLYSSTLYVLTTIAPYLKKDDIIIFDEFLSPQHEFLAFNNFCQAFPHIKLGALGAANNYTFVAFKVL